ncbi:MAG: methyltransferase domain-containing protein [Bacteroidia bacterium]
MTRSQDWFIDWFDSPYYDLLYKNRDENEARVFLDNLLKYLKLGSNIKVLDLACGKGRHSKILSEHVQEVVGLDLSQRKIEFAQGLSNSNLKFVRHDMRKPFPSGPYRVIFNLFTSFGYFKNENEHLATLENCCSALEEGGVFVMDFLNIEYVRNNANQKEVKEQDGISFIIEKKLQNGYLHKSISFNADGKHYQFQERIRAYSKEDLHDMLSKVKLNIAALFGSYQLEQFDTLNSERLILIARK